MRPTESTRSLPLAFLALLVLLFLGRGLSAWWERDHPPAAGAVPNPFNMGAHVSSPSPAAPVAERVRWLPPAAAIDAARAQRRPILYDFSAEWCGPCRRLNQEVFADARLGPLVEQAFVPARVLDRQREEGRNAAIVDSLQQHFAIQAFPTLIVARADGSEVGRVVGYPGREAIADSFAAFDRRARAGL